jgi:hypothetical protein
MGFDPVRGDMFIDHEPYPVRFRSEERIRVECNDSRIIPLLRTELVLESTLRTINIPLLTE